MFGCCTMKSIQLSIVKCRGGPLTFLELFCGWGLIIALIPQVIRFIYLFAHLNKTSLMFWRALYKPLVTFMPQRMSSLLCRALNKECQSVLTIKRTWLSINWSHLHFLFNKTRIHFLPFKSLHIDQQDCTQSKPAVAQGLLWKADSCAYVPSTCYC